MSEECRKSLNPQAKYWRESVMLAIEEAIGTLPNWSSEQWDSIGMDLVVTAENQSLAFGYDAIPNPLEGEIKNIKNAHAKQLDQRDRTEAALQEQVKEYYDRIRYLKWELSEARERGFIK